MKIIFKSNNLLLTILLFLSLVNPVDSRAQGSWIEQDVQPTMSGATKTKTGSDCAIHTRASSRYVYFFDIYSKAWAECDLGIQQNIQAVEAGKHIVFAYTDSLLVAYSSVTSSFQVIAYNGKILSPGSTSPNRGFGCGDNAAYVFTDQDYVYVFDALAGEWTSFYSGTLENATGYGSFWCGDNYVAGSFYRYYPDKYRIVTYSLVTKTFNVTETGGSYDPGITSMTGGFVSTWGGEPESVLFTGYSAFTNEFYYAEEIPPYGSFSAGGPENENGYNFKERNIFGYCITRGTGYGEPRNAKINVFDTQRARWFTHTFTYSPLQSGDVWMTTAGGNNCTFAQEDVVTNELTFIEYLGETSSYQIIKPGVYQPGYMNSGNNFSVFLDNKNNNWFYNSATGFNQTATSESNWINVAPSSDYISFCRYDLSSSLMSIWFYNSQTDRTSKIQTGKDVYSHFKYSPYAYVFAIPSPENLAVFYSPKQDSILSLNTVFADGNSSYGAYGVFAFFYNTNASLLFDAVNMTVTNRNAPPAMSGLSDSLILFKSDNVFDVYDASNGNITTFNLESSSGYANNGGNIILLSNSDYSRFYAFQKGNSQWVELIPEGNTLWYTSARNTAVVARTTKVYAFAPESLTEINEEIKQSGTIALNPNYPNPFYHSTVISFRIPSKSFVTIKIVNATGTEVSTLVSEELADGTYTYTWDASEFSGGVYFCQMTVGEHFLTKKLVLIK